MKNILKKLTLTSAVISGVCVGLSSCDDFLTITPTSSIVEEEFWQDKRDLNNAVMGCYKELVSNTMLSKYIYWGEMRSDNFDRTSTVSATGEIANIMNANLLPTYGQFDWTPMYKAINFCNKVIAHGPEVVEKDQSFSTNDWLPVRAEAVTLRALCHFNLVKTFGEIPYVTTDYNNDSQELKITQSTQLQVVDSIINDLESIKNDAMKDYGNNIDNKGRITKKAVYALLADVYLWRASYKAGNNTPFTKRIIPSYNTIYTADQEFDLTQDYGTSAESDYQQCVNYCDLIIEMSKEELEKQMNETGLNIGGQKLDIQLEDLLIQNVVSRTSNLNLPVSTAGAYGTIFGDGNSRESIFELQVDGTTYGNGMARELFWNSKKITAGTLTGSLPLFESVAGTPNSDKPEYVYTKTDYRRWENFMYSKDAQTSYTILKHSSSRVTQVDGNKAMLTDNSADNSANLYVGHTEQSVYTDQKGDIHYKSNWIVYRMSEIYLMKAEALSQISADEENLKEAFRYVREVFKRSNPYAYAPGNNTAKEDSLNFETFASQDAMERLVLSERQREFIAEGKRWYDLVRFAQRRGGTQDMLDILCKKYSGNSKSIKAKLADIQSLFSPVKESELKSNTWLYQNGVWESANSTSKTDNL